MLQKTKRISQKKEFDELRKSGKIVHTPLFGFLWQIKPDKEVRFGFVVSKKISKRAVDRNKIRRRLAEVLRENWQQFGVGTRGIFLVKKRILEATVEEIREEVIKVSKIIQNKRND